MATVEFIFDGAVIHTSESRIAGDSQTQTVDQYDLGQRVVIDSEVYLVDRIDHDMDADTVEIYLRQ
jgi:hypothetical protein